MLSPLSLISGALDLDRLVEHKDEDENLCHAGLDLFLFRDFGSIPVDRQLAEYGMSQFHDAGVFFRENSEP